MADILGTSIPVFLFVILVLGGGCAFMMGQALASTWRSSLQLLPYSLLLAAFGRFLIHALYDGALLTISGYACDSTVVFIIALLAFRITRARTMVNQYPWLYDRAGLFGWREKG